MKRVLIIIIASVIVASCYKSYLSNTTHPDMGLVVINKILPDDATLPEEGFTIILNGEVYDANSTTTTIDTVFEPGVYTAYIYSNNTEMDIDHDIDGVGDETVISSKVVTNGIVESLTEDLYFGTETITIYADHIVYSDVILSQVTRDIIFNLHITEGDLDNIKSVTATLGGIAGQWECVGDVPLGDAVKISPTFTQGESLVKAEVVNDYLTSSIKVLGITGADQEFTLTITYDDDTFQTITSDLSDKLSDANSNKPTPIVLTGDVQTPVAGSIEDATIDNWETGDGGTQTVN